MKKMLIEASLFTTGMGVLGYMYFKKHPEVMNKSKDLIKEASRKVYIMMDE